MKLETEWPEATRCPHCQRIIASRRRTKCGFCEEELPSGFRFSRRQARNVAARVAATESRLGPDRNEPTTATDIKLPDPPSARERLAVLCSLMDV